VESTVRSVAFDFTNEEETGIQYLEYPVRKTGYYCVMVWPVQVDGQITSFTGTLEFNNKYGFLAGVDFPKLAVRSVFAFQRAKAPLVIDVYLASLILTMIVHSCMS